MTPNRSPWGWNLNKCGCGLSAKHSSPPGGRSNWVASGLAYESLTWRCVIVEPLTYTHAQTPTPTGGRADRWQRRQEVSDWVTLNKHWQLPDGWIELTSVPHISAARDPPPVSQHLAPDSLLCVFLHHSIPFASSRQSKLNSPVVLFTRPEIVTM